MVSNAQESTACLEHKLLIPVYLVNKREWHHKGPLSQAAVICFQKWLGVDQLFLQRHYQLILKTKTMERRKSFVIV